MTSEFKKLLSREFGEEEYNAYFEYANRMFQRKGRQLKDAKQRILEH